MGLLARPTPEKVDIVEKPKGVAREGLAKICTRQNVSMDRDEKGTRRLVVTHSERM